MRVGMRKLETSNFSARGLLRQALLIVLASMLFVLASMLSAVFGWLVFQRVHRRPSGGHRRPSGAEPSQPPNREQIIEDLTEDEQRQLLDELGRQL